MNVQKAAKTVAAVFAFRDWKWYGDDGHTVPDAERIAETMESLLDSVPPGGYTETGRLLVVDDEEETKLCLVLGRQA